MTTTNNVVLQKIATANESIWMRFGAVSENMHDPEKALYCYENALRHNLYNVKALTQAASICRMREQYPKAVEYFQRILNVEQTNGEIWGALGHCYLMMDDLQKAYTAYQQALYHLPNPKDPNLWYGIGILYDRYGSYEHAEEAFTAVLKMDPKFEKANEIYFRLGIIYKQQMKHDQALDCFKYILHKPPRPLVQADIWFQIGHVYELQKDFHSAKDAYERVLKENPTHAKVLQQLGWLYHHNTTFGNQEIAISFLMRSIDADPSDGQTWYLLGRCYMAQQKYRKAYDAYQQAVYRDGRNPTFWCSIGVLYYQINQYRDALDAYSRAIRLNPYLSEVWYDLGTLYESCNQISDSLDAYQRAAELDPNNKHIQQRLSMLRTQIAGGGKPTNAAANNNKEALSSSSENQLNNSGSTPKDGENGEKNGENERPAHIMTLEPRTSSAPGHTLSEGMNSIRRPPSANGNAIPNVPDIVDLSREEKLRLPSATELNSSLSDSKTAQKSVSDEESGKLNKSFEGEKKTEEKEAKTPEKEKPETEAATPSPTTTTTTTTTKTKSPTKDDDYYDRESDSDKDTPSGLQVDETPREGEPSTPTEPSPMEVDRAERERAGRAPREEGEESPNGEETKTTNGESGEASPSLKRAPEPAETTETTPTTSTSSAKRQKKHMVNNDEEEPPEEKADEGSPHSSESPNESPRSLPPSPQDKGKLKEHKRESKNRK